MSRKKADCGRYAAVTTALSEAPPVDEVDDAIYTPLLCMVKALPYPQQYTKRLMADTSVQKVMCAGVLYVDRLDAFTRIRQAERDCPFVMRLPDYVAPIQAIAEINPYLAGTIKNDPSIVMRRYHVPGSKGDVKVERAVSKAELLEFCARKQHTLHPRFLKRLKNLC